MAMLMLAGLVIAALPWILALRPRIGGLAAIAAVTLIVPALVMAIMLLAHATGLPLSFGVLVLVFATGVAGWAWLARAVGVRAAFASLSWTQWWPAGVGAGIALGTFLLAGVLPGASRVAWAMLGDSGSQLVEARLMMAAGGIAPPPLSNPVPLTPALVAAISAPGRPASGAAEIFQHDLAAYTLTWAALIIASCALAGLVGHAVVRQPARLTGVGARVTIAATSLLPLGWFWTGYPVKFGFINAHLVYVILLAAILAYLGTLRRPWLGLGLQLLAVVLVILTWSPLAIVPLALACAHSVAVFRSWAGVSRGARVAGAFAGLVTLVIGVVLGVPMLLEARGSLNIAGGLAEFPKPMLPLAAAMLVTFVLVTPWRFSRAGVGLLAVGVAAMTGLGVVVVLSGQLTGPWSYYPHKYAWIAAAVVLTLALPQAICAAKEMRARGARAVIYAGAALAVIVSLGFGSWWAPGDTALLRNSLPLLILVEDDLPDQGQSPDAVADAVVERVGLPRLTIPWRSSIANDYRAAFWLIQLERERAILRGDGVAAGELWFLANFHETPEDLCRLADVVPRGLTVQTADDGLSGETQTLCPAADIVVEGEPADA